MKLLLDKWQKGKGGGLNQFGLTVKTLQEVLARVAFAAHKRHSETPNVRDDAIADISRQDLFDALEPELGGDLNKTRDVIEYMQMRAGLLSPEGNNVYRFPHRSYQEFMAACDALNTRHYPKDLAKLVTQKPTWWREVYLLAAGRIQQVRYVLAVDAIDAVCQENPPPNLDAAATAMQSHHDC